MTQGHDMNAQGEPVARGFGMGSGPAPTQPAPQATPGIPQGPAPNMPPAAMPGGAYAPQRGYVPGYAAYPGQQAPGQQVGYWQPGGRVPYPGHPLPQGYPTPRPPKKKRGVGFWIAIVVAIVCLAVACLLVLRMCDDGSSRRQGDLGELDGMSLNEIQAELDRVVEEGMFNISIASIVEFESGTSEGDLRIENIPGNPYLMQVRITLDDTGEQVYESGILEQNHHIRKDTLSVDLPAGTYPATATFTALDPQTEAEVGQASATMTLVIQS